MQKASTHAGLIIRTTQGLATIQTTPYSIAVARQKQLCLNLLIKVI